jgi:hypothetical protein
VPCAPPYPLQARADCATATLNGLLRSGVRVFRVASKVCCDLVHDRLMDMSATAPHDQRCFHLKVNIECSGYYVPVDVYPSVTVNGVVEAVVLFPSVHDCLHTTPGIGGKLRAANALFFGVVGAPLTSEDLARQRRMDHCEDLPPRDVLNMFRWVFVALEDHVWQMAVALLEAGNGIHDVYLAVQAVAAGEIQPASCACVCVASAFTVHAYVLQDTRCNCIAITFA